MCSALRKRPENRARAAAAFGPTVPRLACEHPRAAEQAPTSRQPIGGGR